MNIFAVDRDPEKAARALCDKHVIKMTLETAQLLCAAFPPGKAPYKATHVNHPCAIWVRTSLDNYVWAVEHGLALSDEYTRRYGKVHKTHAVLCTLKPLHKRVSFPVRHLTPFAQALPADLKRTNAILAYRAYYHRDKASIATWKSPATPPFWWNP